MFSFEHEFEFQTRFAVVNVCVSVRLKLKITRGVIYLYFCWCCGKLWKEWIPRIGHTKKLIFVCWCALKIAGRNCANGIARSDCGALLAHTNVTGKAKPLWKKKQKPPQRKLINDRPDCAVIDPCDSKLFIAIYYSLRCSLREAGANIF